jgi:hypothetical protein
LKTPYRDGTTHVIFEPEDFIARLVALVPKPRAHLSRYHGIFAPALSWAQRLRRVFRIDIETCQRCGGKLRVIASIEAQAVIDRILGHPGRATEPLDLARPVRGPPPGALPF